MAIELAEGRSRHDPDRPRPRSSRHHDRQAALPSSWSCSPASSDGNTSNPVARRSRSSARRASSATAPEGGPERHHLYVAPGMPVVPAGGDRPRGHRAGDRHLGYAHPYRDERGLGVHRWPLHRSRSTASSSSSRPTTRPTRASRAASSVPVLWDKEAGRIVNNESADIVVIFDEWTGGRSTRRTSARRSTRSPDWIYDEFQNGVYRAGFSRSQAAYDEAFRGVFSALDRMETPPGRAAATSPATPSRSPTGACSHAAALRRRLPHALPLQRQAADRVPEPAPLHPRAVRAAAVSPRRSRSTRSKSTTTRRTTS